MSCPSQSELHPRRLPDYHLAMAKPKISSRQYQAAIAAARQVGGDENQSHWEARLKAVVNRRTKGAKKPATRQASHPISARPAVLFPALAWMFGRSDDATAGFADRWIGNALAGNARLVQERGRAAGRRPKAAYLQRRR